MLGHPVFFFRNDNLQIQILIHDQQAKAQRTWLGFARRHVVLPARTTTDVQAPTTTDAKPSSASQPISFWLTSTFVNHVDDDENSADAAMLFVCGTEISGKTAASMEL
jgi:hypothetical protein